MTERKITEVRVAHPSRDGAGVAISRVSGMQHAGMDPILMIDELRATRREDVSGGFPPHPHRGMQTLTYLKQGGLIHEDSRGNRGEISAGGAQWMSAGRGIIHSEMPTGDSEGLHGFQLWINLPRADKMSEPRYRDLAAGEMARLEGEGFEATAVAGEWSIGDDALTGPLQELAGRAAVLELVLAPDAAVSIEMPHSDTALAYIFEGNLVHDDGVLGERRLLVSSHGGRWQLAAGPAGAGLLLMRGQALGEPVAHYGPFVMNTPEEIEQAVRDYQSGDLG